MNDIKNFENILHGIENEEVEKAIKYFKHLIKTWAGSGSQNHYELAIQALEKQVPKKPISAGEEYSTYYCPCCRKHMIINQFNYCPDCGQATDWRNKDE